MCSGILTRTQGYGEQTERLREAWRYKEEDTHTHSTVGRKKERDIKSSKEKKGEKDKEERREEVKERKEKVDMKRNLGGKEKKEKGWGRRKKGRDPCIPFSSHQSQGRVFRNSLSKKHS